MVVSHASIFVPCWNWAMLAQARSNVSCTRSSARSGLRQSEIANARRRGMAASMAARSEGSSSMIAVPYRGALCRRPGTKSQASLRQSIARMRRSRSFRIAAIRRPLRRSGVGSLYELEPSIAGAHAARRMPPSGGSHCASEVGHCLRSFRRNRCGQTGDRDAHATRDPGSVVRMGFVEMCDLALDDLDRHALHGLGNVVHQPGSFIRIHKAEQIARLPVIVVAVAVIVAVGVAGDLQRRLAEPLVLRRAVE